MRQSGGHYPALPRIIECVRTGYAQGRAAGLEAEARYFEELIIGPVGRQLRGLFFNMTEQKKNPFGKPDKAVRRLGVLGAGLMGGGIAQVSAKKGFEVLLKDPDQNAMAQTQAQIWKGLQKSRRRGTIDRGDALRISDRLRPQKDYRHFGSVDLVIEAAAERMDLKKKIIAELEAHCGPETLLASNTSSLSLTEMAEGAQYPNRVLGLHYFSPVPKMPLLEIVRTPHTSTEALAAAHAFGTAQGKTCVVVKDAPGFYVNRILAPYVNECLLMLEEGLRIEDIDRAMKRLGFPIGPLSLLDQIGLDVAAQVVSGIGDHFAAIRPGAKISQGITRMHAAGCLGKKNGQGFYRYAKKGRARPAGSKGLCLFRPSRKPIHARGKNPGTGFFGHAQRGFALP